MIKQGGRQYNRRRAKSIVNGVAPLTQAHGSIFIEPLVHNGRMLNRVAFNSSKCSRRRANALTLSVPIATKVEML